MDRVIWKSVTAVTLVLLSVTAVEVMAGADPDEFPGQDKTLNSETLVAQAARSVDQASDSQDPVAPEPHQETNAVNQQVVEIDGKEYLLVSPKSLPPQEKRARLHLSDKAATFEYERSAHMFNIERGRIALGFLGTEKRDTVLSGSLLLDSNPRLLPGVRLSFGARSYIALLGFENSDVVGVSLGAEADFKVPLEWLPLRFSAGLFYSPDVVTFGQADRIFDWNINIGIPLRERLSAFIGLRYLKFDTLSGGDIVDNGVHVGFRWSFRDS